MESLLEFRLTDGSQSLLPVIAPVGIGVGGESYNINADWAASSLAQAMKVDQLIYVTDQNGVLDGQCEMGGELISELDLKSMGRLIQTQVVRGGMLAKLNAVQSALNGGVPKVWIVNGRSPGILKQLLLEKINTGTRCTPGLNQPLFLEKEEVIHV
jgi:acetylglutamate kinase